MPKVKPRSSRRAPPLKDSDYDHEIVLVDHAAAEAAARTGSPESAAGPSVDRQSTNEPLVPPRSSSSPKPPPQSDPALEPTFRPPIPPTGGPTVEVQEPTPLEHPQVQNGSKTKHSVGKEPESAIDILYENERGGFLCGVALFSSKALGNLDPPAWTNFAHRPSPTSIRNAQVPDPSWEWAWPEWKVNHGEGCDEGGWKYSFMFAKKFSWHGPKWYNSFVRRRAWIRKRVKKGDDTSVDPHLLNPEYFTIEPAMDVRRSSSRASSRLESRASASQVSNLDTDAEEEKLVIEGVDTLLQVLREARIDREKIEAVDNYLEHGEDELAGLQDEMHGIMAFFVFQASRKLLLMRLTQVYDETVKDQKRENSPIIERKAAHLKAAIKHADEELRKMEYWSDIKALADSGESKGAVDQRQGWDNTWRGLDKSGPAQPGRPKGS